MARIVVHTAFVSHYVSHDMTQAVIPRPLTAWSKYFPKLVHVVFVVGVVALVQVFLRVLFSLSVPFHQTCVLFPLSSTSLKHHKNCLCVTWHIDSEFSKERTSLIFSDQ
jgi:hypothetical protein